MSKPFSKPHNTDDETRYFEYIMMRNKLRNLVTTGKLHEKLARGTQDDNYQYLECMVNWQTGTRTEK